MEINKHFCDYRQSLGLKELGFDEECLGFFKLNINALFNNVESELIINVNPEHLTCQKQMTYIFGQNTLLAPLKSQAFEFFREKYGLEPQVKSWKEKGGIVWHYSIQKIGEPSIFRSIDCAVDSYEEAELICLVKLIEIVKTNKHENI